MIYFLMHLYDWLTYDESLFSKAYSTCGLVFLRELEVFVKLLSVLDKRTEICDGMCRTWRKWNGNGDVRNPI